MNEYYKYLNKNNIKNCDDEKKCDDRKNCFGKKNIIKCLKCENNNIIKQEGSLTCNDCGYIIGPIINYDDDTRYYGIDDSKYTNNPSRFGIPINPYAPKSSLGTIIKTNKYNSLFILHKWYSTYYKERSLLTAFNNIQECFSNNNINLPINIFDTAKFFYNLTYKYSIRRGASRKALMAVSVYYACKIKNYKILTKKSLSKIFDIKQNKITTCSKEFHDIIFNTNKKYLSKIVPITYEELFIFYGKHLNIENKYVIISIIIGKFADETGIISVNTPNSIASGCIYYVLNEFNIPINKKIISQKCLISEVTISKTNSKLKTNSHHIKRLIDYSKKYIQ